MNSARKQFFLERIQNKMIGTFSLWQFSWYENWNEYFIEICEKYAQTRAHSRSIIPENNRGKNT